MGGIVVVAERLDRERPRSLAGVTPERWSEIAHRFPVFPDGRSRRRLRELGVEVDRLPAVNLAPPDRQSVPWDADFAEASALRMLTRLTREFDVMVVCGVRACVALNVLRRGNPVTEVYGHPLRPYRPDGTVVVPVPHPSGLNRWWNEPARVAALADRLSRLELRRYCDAQGR